VTKITFLSEHTIHFSISELAQSLSMAASFVRNDLCCESIRCQTLLLRERSAYFFCAFSILAQESRSDTV